MIKEIKQLREKLIKETRKIPSTLLLTKEHMRELENDLREAKLKDRERDSKERLCPELLPPMRETAEVTEGCIIYGMMIMESDGPIMRCEI